MEIEEEEVAEEEEVLEKVLIASHFLWLVLTKGNFVISQIYCVLLC